MAMLRCMNCMKEYNEKQNKCPHCGYMKTQLSKEDMYLPQETTLQRRYIVGNVLREQENEVIYIGWDSVLDKRIAIKEYYPIHWAKRMAGHKEISCGLEADKAQFMRGLEQFISEAQQLAKFREDTGVIRIYDSFEENGTAYTIIEYTESLRTPVVVNSKEEKSSWQQCKKIFHIGWGIGMVAMLLLVVLIDMEMNAEASDADSNSIPNIVGLSYQQAEKELNALGVEIEREKYCYSDVVNADVITCQSIPHGTKLEEDMVVKVVVTRAHEDGVADEQEEDKQLENADETQKESLKDRVTTEEMTTKQASTSEESTTRSTTEQTTQQTTRATTREKTTQKKTQKKTEKKTTEKKTEKKTTQEKTTEKKTTEKATTEEEVIVIED